MANENQIGLLELQRMISDALEERFSRMVWLKAEISEVKVNYSGHCYLTLVEKDRESVVAKSPAVIWASTFRTLGPYFESGTGRQLSSGMSVLLRVQVQYSALYGLSLIVCDIDPSFTVGELELERQRTIARLKTEGMFDMNSSLVLPALPRRFAVITSGTAAGYRDFMRHLHENEFGFSFRTTLFPAVMQGDACPGSIISALDKVSERLGEFDAVLIMRGGGGAMDLTCFDNYDLAVNVAQFPIPVLTGVGHDHDYHVIDMVAHTNVKTPTALADMIIDIFSGEYARLESLVQRMQFSLRLRCESQNASVDSWKMRIYNAASARIMAESGRIDLLDARIKAADPAEILAKGFAAVSRDGGRVVSAGAVSPGDEVRLLFRDGAVDCKVLKINKI